MAITKIESVPSMNGKTLPDNAGTLIRGEKGGSEKSTEWGIDNTIANCIIQSENITEEVITDQTQDQKGAVVSELDYDHHWTLSLTLLCDSASAPITGTGSAFDVGDTTFTYGANGEKWKVKTVAYTGSYNAKKQYVVTAERWTNFPK